MGQLLLIPDPRPLDQRLGRDFFRQAPRQPGVYLMKDARDNVLYVGKAKDLKQRLSNYRVANPDRMPRRHLRMVTEVQRIELRVLRHRTAALEQEARLLRALKPKFNRAGVWPGKTRFIAWRVREDHLDLTVVETPGADWRRFGPMGSSAFHLQHTLSRLLWLVLIRRVRLRSFRRGGRGCFHGDRRPSNAGRQLGRWSRSWNPSSGMRRMHFFFGWNRNSRREPIRSTVRRSRRNWRASKNLGRSRS